MAFEIPKQPYSGRVGQTVVGTGATGIALGGSEAYPFHLFEGKMPHAPKIAMEIWDYDPSDEWPSAGLEPFRDVISSPEAWARKCVSEYGADIIVLQLKSTDPNGMDRGAEEAARVASKVLESVDVPVIFWGTANSQKDEEVLKKLSELAQGKNVGLAPVEERNHRGIGAAALGYGHTVVASSPIDVNLAKQLNILLGNLGVEGTKILIDPTTGGLGYGLEYSYSVIERIRMAALTQEDEKLQMPIISNVGNEVWKCKEAGQSPEVAPTLGDPEKRGILMETVAATCYLMAGADVVILRHPESVRLIRSFIDRMSKGGSALEVEAIAKRLPEREVDLASMAPPPDLALERGETGPKAGSAKPAPEPRKEEPPKAAAKVEEKVEDQKAKREAQAKAEAEARATAEAKARAEAEETAMAKAKAEARARSKENEELHAHRQERAVEKARPEPDGKGHGGGKVPKTAAASSLDLIERLGRNLDRIHRRK